MTVLKRIIFSIFTLASVNSFADTPTVLQISDLIFPASKSWRNLQKSALVPNEELRRLTPELIKSYLTTEAATYDFIKDDNGDCSFMVRALNRAAQDNNFHQIDIDNDGFLDIAYTGSAECHEGNTTIIWYGAVNGLSERKPILLENTLLLRVSSEGLDTSNVSEGCCADPLDTYFLRNLNRPDVLDKVSLLKKTVIPKLSLKNEIRFIAKKGLVLRSAPSITNAYDPSWSAYIGRAVFGTIVKKYLPGSKGTLVAQQIKSGQKWGFVVMGLESDSLAYYDPYNTINSGWVLMTNNAHELQFVRPTSKAYRAN